MPIAPTRAPCSTSMRRSSRASPPSRRSPSSRRCAGSISTRSGAARSASSRNCRRRSAAIHCWRCWGSIARSRRAKARRNFEGSVTGMWRAPLRLKVKLCGSRAGCRRAGHRRAVGAGAKGRRQSHGSPRQSRAAVRSQAVRHAGAKHQPCPRAFRWRGNRLIFDDLDSAMSGSRLRGRLALTLDEQKSVEGEVGLDSLDLAPAFALAIGAAGHDAAEPLGPGLTKGWRGRIAFQALRGMLAGRRRIASRQRHDQERRPVADVRGHQGRNRRRRGDRQYRCQADRERNCVECERSTLRCRWHGLRYRALAMPAGRASMQMTLSSQGRSASALTGALSGSGTVTLESARIAGLDPRAFDAAIRASDNGQATDDLRLRQIVEPVPVGRRVVGHVGADSVQHQGRPASRRRDHARCRGRARHRVGRLRYSRRPGRHSRRLCFDRGGYRRPAVRKFSCSRWARPTRSIAPSTSAALSSWLAVRAIDRETRRLDAIERGEPPPPLPASIPPDVDLPVLAPSDVPTTSHGPQRPPQKPRAGVARPPAAPPNAPVVSQQVAPLPPPIEVRPAPECGATAEAAATAGLDASGHGAAAAGVLGRKRQPFFRKGHSRGRRLTGVSPNANVRTPPAKHVVSAETTEIAVPSKVRLR